MNKPKLSVILSLVFVFVSGAVLGIFAYRLYSAQLVQTPVAVNTPGPPQKRGPEDFRKWYVPTLTKELKLDAAQVTQLNVILDQTDQEAHQVSERHKAERDAINAQRDAFREKVHPEFVAVHNHQVEQINAMLTPQQRDRYAAWRAERDRQRKIVRDQQKKQ